MIFKHFFVFCANIKLGFGPATITVLHFLSLKIKQSCHLADKGPNATNLKDESALL